MSGVSASHPSASLLFNQRTTLPGLVMDFAQLIRVSRLYQILSSRNNWVFGLEPRRERPMESASGAIAAQDPAALAPVQFSPPYPFICSSDVENLKPSSCRFGFIFVLNSAGDNESRSVLDAFFLGKALAEALNERIESTVGEFLSAIGRLQAEQQRQIQDFQVDVLERAKRAKENAAREAMGAQGLVSNATTVDPKSAAYDINSETSNLHHQPSMLLLLQTHPQFQIQLLSQLLRRV
ncbi:hypothetical protein GH714_025907 [Hevea brasiliensis]|uniref:Uncharacterized protein n=1 Tax=Hevea brasiliensis TaxID=3981 RepID=A0A6A6K7Z6_HEVBR|nr:hypothetical protein GH714_025907 [Hevea brasiliensis]